MNTVASRPAETKRARKAVRTPTKASPSTHKPEQVLASATLPQARKTPPTVLFGIAIFLAMGVGFLLGVNHLPVMPDFTPQAIKAAVASTAPIESAAFASIDHKLKSQQQDTEIQNVAVAQEIGRMRAEMVRLHALMMHLADVAQLESSEFEADVSPVLWESASNVITPSLLKPQLAHISSNTDRLASIFKARRVAHDQRISGKPVKNGSRTSGFGVRTHPLTGARDMHLGVDFSARTGESIYALAQGIVTFAGIRPGYGNLVELEHVDGFQTRYAHNEANLVEPGERVAKGQLIATLGSTGRSTGPHVHVEVRHNGEAVDPGIFIR